MKWRTIGVMAISVINDREMAEIPNQWRRGLGEMYIMAENVVSAVVIYSWPVITMQPADLLSPEMIIDDIQ